MGGRKVQLQQPDAPFNRQISLSSRPSIYWNRICSTKEKLIVMKPSLRSLFLAAVLLIAVQASAQNLIFYQNTKSEAFLFKNGGGGPSGPLVDYFIQTIARGNGKPTGSTEYILAHDHNVRLTKVDATHFDINASLSNFRLTGDTKYRGFTMDEILKPKAIRFRLEHQDAQGKPQQGWDYTDVAINADPAPIASLRATDSTGIFNSDIVVVADKQFLYTDVNRLAFQARVDLIDDYYKTTPTLEATYTDLKKIQPADIDRLDNNEYELTRLETGIQAIRDKNYPGNLGLNAQNDPADFLRRFGEIDALSRDLRTRINDTRARLHVFYHDRGLAQLQAQKPALARADFTKAISLAPKFAPSHVELARMSYAEGNLSEAVNRLQFTFSDTQMDDPTRASATTLGKTIYGNHLGNANYAIQKSEFDKALAEADLAKALCTKIPAVGCDQQLDGIYSRAHRGVYLARVSAGVKAESENKLDIAEQEGAAALLYQTRNAAAVGEPREAQALLGRVRKAKFSALVAKADQEFAAGQLEAAEKSSRDAIAYQAANRTDVTDPAPANAVLNKVMARRYSDAIAAGKAKTKAGQHAEALASLELAKGWETQYAFKADTSLGTQLRASAKQVLLIKAPEALNLAKANRLQEARDVTTSFDQLSARYNLGSDQQVAAGRQQIQEAIFSQECINAEATYRDLVAAADEQKNLRHFVEAEEGWKKALNHARTHAACGIATRAVDEALVTYHPAADYQRLVREADAAVQNVNHSNAIERYNKAGDLFYAQNLGGSFGLAHANLLDYARNSGKRDFMLATANHFIGLKAYEQAYDLSYDLATHGYSAKLLKPTLTRLGKELAIRDKAIDFAADPKVKAATYTKAQPTMKTLGKAYLKQWKAM